MLRAIAAATFLLTAPAFAQEAHPSHGAPPTAAVDSAAANAFAAVNRKMHEDMTIDYSGDPDAAFVKGMIAHHQGAVDMANVVLQFGEDEEIKKLANDIIAAQTAEIAWMREWLARKGQP